MGCFCSTGAPTEALEYEKIKSIWNVVKFVRILGNGSSAQVCLVSSLETEKLYALKIMGDEYYSVFLEEIRMMKTLDCPYIVRFVEAYKDKNYNYILMEYCSGDSLLGRIVENSNYTESMASATTKTMFLALKYLHDKDIVHRDLKPENFVYLTENDERLKLLDFGIAMEALPDKSYTWQAGTPHYMAPEIIQGGGARSGEICKKGDMWSLGVCIFIMLNGQAPFKGSTLMAIFDNIVAQSKIRFSKKEISKEAKDLIFKLLRRDPKERLTVDEALQHPWIVNGGKNENEFRESTVGALRLFKAKRSVSKALQRVATENLNEYDENYYMQRFNQFDHNGDGHISREECVAALQLSMIYPQEAERLVNEMFENSDLNNDNKIQYDEFKNAMVRQGLSRDQYRINAIFTALDTNRDRKISIAEFTNCLPQGDDKQIGELVAAFREADENKDDYLSFQEFTRVLNLSPEWITKIFKRMESEEIDHVIDIDGHGAGSRLEATTKEKVKLEIIDSNGIVLNVE